MRQTQAAYVGVSRLSQDRVQTVASATHPLSHSTDMRISGATLRYLRDTRDLSELLPGSIWRFSELKHDVGFDRSQVAEQMRREPAVITVVTVILEAGEDRIDGFDMLFEIAPKVHPELPVNIITQALADAWGVRSPGLVSALIGAQSRSRARRIDGPRTGILGEQNPCRLSRAEQRLCHLLLAGEKAKSIAEILGISMATVRSHLSNIYSKTQTSGQVELIATINAERGAAA